MEPIVKVSPKKRVSCHERIKQLRKEMNYKPPEEPTFDSIVEIHVEHSEKEKKKIKKQREKAIETRMWELFSTYSDSIQRMLLKMSYDDMVQWIINEESIIEEANSGKELTVDEFISTYFSNMDTKSGDGLWDIPDSQMEAYEKYLKDKKLRDISDIRKYRHKFLKKIENANKKYRKGKGKRGLNLYDPLFHGADTDMRELKKNLKRLTEDNRKRVDEFLKCIESLTGQSANNIPIVKSFKEKTDKILKRSNKWLDSQGFSDTDLPFDF